MTEIELSAPADAARPAAALPRVGFGPLSRFGLAPLPLLALLLASAIAPGATPVVPVRWFLPIHTGVELVVTAMGLATFGVQWFAAGAGTLRNARARFIGPALLAVAAFEAMHFLAYPGMPGFFGDSTTETGIRYWLAGRLWFVGAPLVAVFIRPDAESPWLSRRRLLALNAAGVAVVVAADLLTREHSYFFRPGEGLTPLKLGLEGLVLALALAGAAWYLARARATGELGPRRIAAALGVSALSEICFMRYQSPYDLFNLLGHAYLVVAMLYAFAGLFIAALLKPYQDLAALQAHVEGELEVTIEQLEHARAQREDLFRAVSHDLRNPLQIILLQAERIARAIPDGAPARAAVAIAGAGRRMGFMLRDLADSARLESGQLNLERRAVDVRALLAELVSLADGVLDSARVENAVPADLPPAFADPDRLERILTNLVGNALNYSSGSVRVTAAADGTGVLRVSVADEGPGIAPEDLPRLFDRYYRGRRHEGEGLGLGLFIVTKLVQAHGGLISVESPPGHGATFTFTLPVAP
jgi:signal transduction histidine kinase